MDVTSIFYPILIIFCLFLFYSNFKNNKKYKSENMKVLLNLNADDKTMHIASGFLLALLLFYTFVVIYGMVKSNIFVLRDVLIAIIVFGLFVILYVPITKKTRVTTLGILKRNNMIRWEDIKGINYSKPDAKGKSKAIILHRTAYKDATTNILFNKDDEQLEMFKELAKENRNSKKKDKKSGK